MAEWRIESERQNARFEGERQNARFGVKGRMQGLRVKG